MRRPPTHTADGLAEESPPATGHARYTGRVGALAVFLGVGAALAMPAAHADTDGSSSSDSSSSESSSSDTSSDSGAANDSGPSNDSDPSAESSSPSSYTTRTVESPDDAAEPSAQPDSESNDPDGELTDTDEPDASDDESEPADISAFSANQSAPTLFDSSHGAAQEVNADDHQSVAPVAPTTTQTPVVGAPAASTVTRSDIDDPQTPVTSPAEVAVAAHSRRQGGTDAGTAATISAAAAQNATSVDDSSLTNQVSPLGTPEQIARERIAMETAKSLPVAFMKLILRLGFLAAAEEQFALVGGPDTANLNALDNAVDEYALASAFSQQILNPMDPAVVTQVAPPHNWYGLDVGGSRLLYDNPDTIYRFIPVNKTSEYVLTGRIYEGIPADTTFSVLEGLSGTTSTILSLQDLDISEDGTFVITVSGDAAAPGQTNHLQLTSSSTLIAARNTLGDWEVEEPMELAVHRVDGPRNSLFAQLGGFVFLGPVVNDSPLLTSLVSLIPPLGIADTPLVRGPLTALIMLVRGANEEAKYMALATTDTETGELRPPNVMTQPASNAEFLANQLQSNGYFQIADDEALVLTIDPGNSGFFTVPVYNDWTITDDYWNEQTSLNNDQAVANPDGTYTMVVSIADPAVANWISTGGLNQGIISMRFQNLDPDSMDIPGVQSVVVKLEDLEDHLPAGTVFVTPEERAAQLAARKAGFDKRWAPYPQA